MGSGIGLFLNEIQFLNLFPANVGFLIGACNALCNVGSFFPLAWKIIIENDYLSYSGNGISWKSEISSTKKFRDDITDP